MSAHVVEPSQTALDVVVESLALKAPFRISGHVFADVGVVVTTLSRNGLQGRGEASGVYYLDDAPPSAAATLESLRQEVAGGLDRQALQDLLTPGGARNALDCALWELESRARGVPVWRLAQAPEPSPLLTTFTLGAESPGVMAQAAAALREARALKLKLSGDPELDAARVRAVRQQRPDVWLGVDANQGYGPDTLEPLTRVLVDSRVALLEQPFRRGEEAALDGLALPLPIAADESCQDLEELETLPGRFDVVNIKLDKCGGLTEGLAMAKRARELGLKVMVGNMVGTSLAMAPGFVLGQFCDVVDLDGPTFLAVDRTPRVTYRAGEIWCPESLWGAAEPAPSVTPAG